MRIPAFGQADLSNCEREPIHLPGSVQPYGVLLAMDPDGLRIEQVAGDVAARFGRPAEAILGASLESLVGPEPAARIADLTAPGNDLPRTHVLLASISAGGQLQDALLHVADGVALLDLLPRSGEDDEPLAIVQTMIARTRKADGDQAFYDAMAEAVAAATGYDRVLVYRFRDDGSGRVVAEVRDPDLEPYLGLHYPASDVPRQARELYLKNWLRLIPDVRYAPAPVIPAANPRTGRPLDLGHSVLRSVSPLHLEYLSNMGVAATMVLSLVVGGSLWGMIACHHRAPRMVDLGRRVACELFAQMVSLQLEARIEAARSSARLRCRETGAALLRAADRDGLAAGLLRGAPTLLDLVHAGGAAVWDGGAMTGVGATPSQAQTAELMRRLDSDAFADGVYSTEELAALDPAFRGLADVAAGLLAVDLGGGIRLLWFRPEEVSTVTWAGNPHKPVETGPDGERLTPRKSFEAWRETVRLRSQRWGCVEKEAAGALRLALLDVVLHHLDTVRREREKAARQQDVLLAELDHRVKNTLATIQALVSLSSRTAEDLTSFVTSFQQRLQAMARAHTRVAEARWEAVDLGRLVEDQLEALRPREEGLWAASGPGVVVPPQIGLALGLALNELARNAQQHGSLRHPGGRIDVAWTTEGPAEAPRLTLTWRESGGPPLAPPGPAGFGRTLVERSLAQDVNGRVALDFPPAGLVATISMILGPQPRGEPRDTAERVPGGRILVVEDNALVAMEVEAVLSDAGHRLVGPAARVADGLRLLTSEAFDVALLDVDLHGERVWPVADALLALGRPFAFTTGFRGDIVLPERLVGIEVLGKPYREADLLALTERLLARARSDGAADEG